MSTVEKVEVFQETYKEELDQVLEKLLRFKLEDYRRSLEEYEQDLNRFEKEYSMDSASFYERFESGKLGDAMDFFEWSGIYELYLYVLHKMERIEQVL